MFKNIWNHTEMRNIMVDSVNSIGQKAYNLNKLKKSFNIPRFYSISVNEVKKILESNRITLFDLNKAFKGKREDRDNLRKKIISGKNEFNLDFLPNFGDNLIIRSSAIGEDNPKFSFAGIYESIKCHNDKLLVKSCVLKVISEAFSERVKAYSKTIGLNEFPKFSLFIQDYIKPEFGGVAFTSTYYNGKNGLLINLVRGDLKKAALGEGSKNIFIDKELNIEGQSNIPTNLLKDIFKVLKEVELFIGKPQDIEWLYSNKKIYIVQSRNITKNVEEEIKVYDNSNIAESYSGIVLPLTCSFAKIIYTQVYNDVAKNSNINQKKIRENKEVFENLLAFIYGRMYYDILNWYKMLTLFPGYKRNKKNLENMISIRSKAELDEKYRTNVHFKDKILYYSHILRRITFFEKEISNFKKHTKIYMDKLKSKSSEKMDVSALWEQFEEYKRELLGKWSITVDNDFLAMTWFGLYSQYAKKIKLDENEIISGISSIKSLISADQVKAIGNLSFILKQDNNLLKLAKDEKWEECYKQTMNNQELNKKIKEYIQIYGARFANELKLESKELDSDPVNVIKLIYSYKDWKENKSKSEKELKVSLFQKTVLSYLSNKTKHYLKNREELRLLRSNAFSYTRKLFLAIGKEFVKNRIIKEKEDIFYLKIEEIKSIIEKEDINVKEIIRKRKKDYVLYQKINPDNIIITKNNQFPTKMKDESLNKKEKLSGIGCSPGEVSGKITVLNSFELPKKPLEIIVVKNTDPGWTPIFGLCDGLIVENGGLLSHAAIISRELNLPCIIGVKNATKILKNGQRVTIDGGNGKIST